MKHTHAKYLVLLLLLLPLLAACGGEAGPTATPVTAPTATVDVPATAAVPSEPAATSTTPATSAGDIPTVVDPSSGGLPADITGQLTELMTTLVAPPTSTVEAQQAPGMSLLVITPQGRFFKSMGYADPEKKTP